MHRCHLGTQVVLSRFISCHQRARAQAQLGGRASRAADHPPDRVERVEDPLPSGVSLPWWSRRGDDAWRAWER